MKKILLFSVLVIILGTVIAVLIPVKSSKKEDEISQGYVLRIDQTTGPYWRIDKIIGTNPMDLTVGEQVILRGYDPYVKLGKSVTANPDNRYFFELSFIEDSFDSELNKEFKVLNVDKWNICYPISRESGFLSYSNDYLNVFDFIR
ncbi:MAG: hypothetical protein GX660_22615 [Clostridiaceae bacterium]|nr:hypothetical protein [Clostridiaceae bacterium]